MADVRIHWPHSAERRAGRTLRASHRSARSQCGIATAGNCANRCDGEVRDEELRAPRVDLPIDDSACGATRPRRWTRRGRTAPKYARRQRRDVEAAMVELAR